MSDVDTRRGEQEQRYCARCGASMESGAKFCGACGTPADGATASGQEWKRLTEDVKSVTRAGMDNARKGVARGMQFAGEKFSSAAENMQQESADQEEGKEKPEKKKTGKIVFGVVSAVLIVLLLIGLFGKNPIQDVKDIVFDQYGTQTLGTAVKQSIPEASWDSVKIDDKRYTVTVSGYCPDLFSVVQVDFDVNYSGDYVYAKTMNVWMDGDCYDDIFSIALVMQGIY